MAVSFRSPRLSTLIDDDCDDIECDLMLDALQHHLDQVEGRLTKLLVENEAGTVTNTSKAKTKETEVNEKQLKQESTLPSLLAEYSAAPDTGHTEEQETSYTNQDHLRRRRESEKLREEEEREKQNQKQRDRIERHLALFEQLEHLKEDVRDEYFAALKVKIKRQRHEIEQREKKLEKQMRRAEMKQKKKKERLPRSDGLDDWSFLDHVKQTQYYRIVSLETELKRGGKLKTSSEIQHLWESELFSSSNRQLVALNTVPRRQSDTEDELDNDLTDVDEELHSWAMTTVPEAMLRMSSTHLRKSPKSKREVSKIDDLEKRFPKMTLPPLRILEVKTKDDHPAPDNQLEQRREKVKECKKRYKKKVRMYQQALFNQLATQQILKKHDLFFIQPPVTISEILLPVENATQRHPLPSQTAEAMSPLSHQQQAMTDSVVTNMASLYQTSCNGSESETSLQESDITVSHGSGATGSSSRWDTVGLTSDTSIPSLPKLKERRSYKGGHKQYNSLAHKDRRKRLESESISEVPLQAKVMPLSMDSLLQSQRIVVECKQPSSLWTNYLRT